MLTSSKANLTNSGGRCNQRWLFLGTAFTMTTKFSTLGLASLCLLLLTASCGGGIVGNDAGLSLGGATTSGGSAGVSGSLSSGGAPAVLTSTSTTCQMPASDLLQSCTSDSDCVAVTGGDPCNGNLCRCPIAVYASVSSQYMADFAALSVAHPSVGVCNCPCIVLPCCHLGMCHNDCGTCG